MEGNKEKLMLRGYGFAMPISLPSLHHAMQRSIFIQRIFSVSPSGSIPKIVTIQDIIFHGARMGKRSVSKFSNPFFGRSNVGNGYV